MHETLPIAAIIQALQLGGRFPSHRGSLKLREEKVKKNEKATSWKRKSNSSTASTKLKKSILTHPYSRWKLGPKALGDSQIRATVRPPLLFFLLVFLFFPSLCAAVIAYLSDSYLVLGAVVHKGYWNLYAKLNEHRIKKCLRDIPEMRCQISEVVSL